MKFFLLMISILITAVPALAFENGALGLGIGYYSQNFLGKTSSQDSGQTGFLGQSMYPLLIKYDYQIGDWFLAPQLGYTLFPRKDSGGTNKVSMLQLNFYAGTNISSDGSNKWDWYAGPGLVRYTIEGAGGTTVMNNGTSTAVFAVPGGSSQVQKVTVNFGSSYSFDKSRVGLEIILENAFSSKKRTQSMMLSYQYLLGGGF